MFETDALYQNDPKWKNVKLGNQNKETIGSWGCLMTSMTMVANGYGFDETPETINEKMKSAGGFQGALIIPAVLPSVCPGLVYKGYQPCEDSPAPIGQIDAAIAAGKPVIAQVDWSPKAGVQTHWIVLYDKTGNDYYMKDPYRYSGDAPDKKMKVLSRYKHSGKDIAKAITGVIWIEGSTPPKPKPKVPVPSDSFTVYAAVDGLAFRSDPSVAAALIRRVPLNAKLETLESKADAEAKIGVNGQWIHIQDSTGDQGYTAAWYVSKTVVEEEAESPEPTQPAPTPDDVEYYLIPIADGLAVRSAPDYNAQLIKRVPLNTKFGYFESREEVNKKVGVTNQWVHIYDESGLQGYTAAWYVTRKAGKPPAPPSGSKTPTQPPAQPKPKPQEPAKPITGFAVVPTTDGLAFRSSTTVSDATLIKRLPISTVLGVEEPEDQAKRKIGVNGQWLKVKDSTGRVGYVAAWYVRTAPQSDSGDGGSDGGISVRTTAEGVALRRSTVVADHTLIKRLPNNSTVTALEADAESKIGVNGQWLKVRDASGAEGYVAAWYVTK
jgi:hypothetical protein